MSYATPLYGQESDHYQYALTNERKKNSLQNIQNIQILQFLQFLKFTRGESLLRNAPGGKVKTTKKDLTTGEVARHCQATHFTVNNWIKAGKLRAYRTPGGHHRVRPDDFLAFLTRYSLPIPDDFAPEASQRILLVDDDTNLARVLSLALGLQGYQVETAADGYDAGLKMAAFKPHLLVLDLIMPRIDGFELCTRVKTDPLTQGVKIIAMTGYVEEGNMEKALDAGADICLEKPFGIDQLLQEVLRLLQ